MTLNNLYQHKLFKDEAILNDSDKIRESQLLAKDIVSFENQYSDLIREDELTLSYLLILKAKLKFASNNVSEGASIIQNALLSDNYSIQWSPRSVMGFLKEYARYKDKEATLRLYDQIVNLAPNSKNGRHLGKARESFIHRFLANEE